MDLWLNSEYFVLYFSIKFILSCFFDICFTFSELWNVSENAWLIVLRPHRFSACPVVRGPHGAQTQHTPHPRGLTACRKHGQYFPSTAMTSTKENRNDSFDNFDMFTCSFSQTKQINCLLSPRNRNEKSQDMLSPWCVSQE